MEINAADRNKKTALKIFKRIINRRIRNHPYNVLRKDFEMLYSSNDIRIIHDFAEQLIMNEKVGSIKSKLNKVLGEIYLKSEEEDSDINSNYEQTRIENYTDNTKNPTLDSYNEDVLMSHMEDRVCLLKKAVKKAYDKHDEERRTKNNIKNNNCYFNGVYNDFDNYNHNNRYFNGACNDFYAFDNYDYNNHNDKLKIELPNGEWRHINNIKNNGRYFNGACNDFYAFDGCDYNNYNNEIKIELPNGEWRYINNIENNIDILNKSIIRLYNIRRKAQSSRSGKNINREVQSSRSEKKKNNLLRKYQKLFEEMMAGINERVRNVKSIHKRYSI